MYNEITITGPQEDLQKFYDGLITDPEEGTLSILDSYYPLPQEVKDTEGAWYDWCCTYWGSKWGDYNTDYNEPYNGTLKGFLLSAWDTPTEGFVEVSKRWPSLHFRIDYHECGMNFRGWYTIENGSLEQEQWEMSKNDWDELGYETEEEPEEGEE